MMTIHGVYYIENGQEKIIYWFSNIEAANKFADFCRKNPKNSRTTYYIQAHQVFDSADMLIAE